MFINVFNSYLFLSLLKLSKSKKNSFLSIVLSTSFRPICSASLWKAIGL